ncbi:MAG: hypothetical protein WBO24_02260 [Nitrospirales bacterium]
MSEDLEYPNWVEGESDKDLIEEFFSEVKKKYPDLSESIDWNEDLMHISMGDLQRHAEEMCKSGKLEELKECFKWVEGYFCRSRHELLNAFNVSFLEYFEHQGLSPKEFQELMPVNLYRGYQEQRKCMENLAKKAEEFKNEKSKE